MNKKLLLVLFSVTCLVLTFTFLETSEDYLRNKKHYTWTSSSNNKATCDTNCANAKGYACGFRNFNCCVREKCSWSYECSERILVPGCTDEHAPSECVAACATPLSLCRSSATGSTRNCCAYGCNPSGGCRAGSNGIPGLKRLVGCPEAF